MGANLSERKARSREAQALAENAIGWRKVGDRWEAVDSPRAVLARRGVMVGRCDTGECRRHVTIDLGWWVTHGLGEVSMLTVQRAYACARLGCRLNFRSEACPGGVPLMSYSNEKGAEVIVACNYCGLERRRGVEAFVAAIQKAGTGGPNLPAWNLQGTVTGICPRCGRQTWRVALQVPGKVIGPPPGLGG